MGWRSLPQRQQDLAWIGLAYLITVALSLHLNLFDWIAIHSSPEATFCAGDILIALLITPAGFAFYAARRLQELRQEASLRQAAEAQSSLLALRDPLTGLPNRRQLMAGLSYRLDRRAPQDTVAVLLIDLDRFKPVNDLYGHAVGDQLLRAVADRLRSHARLGDKVARLGGDEFVIVAALEPTPGPSGTQEPAATAVARLARRLTLALEEPFLLGSGEIQATVGASIGVALSTAGTEGAEELLRRADLAMYRAKAEERGSTRFFDGEMDQRMLQRLSLEADLRLAIATEALVPHFQPVVSLGGGGTPRGTLLGFEMLARWPHPTRGLVPPTEFIPLAEETGLISPLTRLLLRQACRAAAAWPGGLVLSVNISPLELRDRTLPAMMTEVLAESGLPPSRLELEITESALINNFNLARELLSALKAIGVTLALDDFGTGYSSLHHLRALPFDKIKVDRNFVGDMVSSQESSKIVAAVIGLGQSLDMTTVAEGIEDDETAAALARMGCDIGQGWLYGKPAMAGEAAELAARAAAHRNASPAAP